jgi:two-component system chemotaxis response regulator CheY
MLSVPTFKILADCIRRDPTSWQGMGLLYLNPFPLSLQAANDDLLVMPGKDGSGILLGVFPPNFISPLNASIVCHIEDIAADSQLATGLLETIGEKATYAPVHAIAGNRKPLAFLLVEDEVMTSKLVAHHLEQFGTVIITKNAREATANNTFYVPDIILLDIHYHDDLYDGFDVLANILSANNKAFVVMFSADRHPATIVRALSMGAQGFIAKPFRADNFSYYIEKYANKAVTNQSNPL